MNRRPSSETGARDRIARLRPFAATIAWGAVALLLVLAGVTARFLRAGSGPHPDGAGADSTEGLPPPPPPEADSWDAAPAPITVSAEAAPRTEAEPTGTERVLLLQEQVRRLREYAALHGPDDPFSLTEEQIEEFRKRGDPVVW